MYYLGTAESQPVFDDYDKMPECLGLLYEEFGTKAQAAAAVIKVCQMARAEVGEDAPVVIGGGVQQVYNNGRVKDSWIIDEYIDGSFKIDA